MPEVKVQLRQVGPTTSESTMPRGHTALVDRPEAKGGHDEGPMGGEYFLTAVGGCFMSTLFAAIRAREAPVTNVRTDVTGVLVDEPTRFESVSLEVSADCDDPELLERLVKIAENGCIMVQSLKRGVRFDARAAANATSA
jgi:putative redox protein